jgi:hypothetical protein
MNSAAQPHRRARNEMRSTKTRLKDSSRSRISDPDEIRWFAR